MSSSKQKMNNQDTPKHSNERFSPKHTGYNKQGSSFPHRCLTLGTDKGCREVALSSKPRLCPHTLSI